jgi:hypothetical protein
LSAGVFGAILVSSANMRGNQRAPTDYRFRLENFQRVHNLGGRAIEPDKHQAIDAAHDGSLRQSAAVAHDLVSKDWDLCLQCTRNQNSRPAELAL